MQSWGQTAHCISDRALNSEVDVSRPVFSIAKVQLCLSQRFNHLLQYSETLFLHAEQCENS